MAVTLQTYITAVQRLLDDANANYWKTPELTDYINEARNRVATDTCCVRQIFGYPISSPVVLTTGQDKYLFTDLIPGQNTVDIINVTTLFGNSRIPCTWRPFTVFNAYFRIWAAYQQYPFVFTTYGASTLWLAPVPNQAYNVELDAAVLPTPLVSLGDTEQQLPVPYTEAVKYDAARLAKLRFQAYNEAEKMEVWYIQRRDQLNSQFPRRIPNIYSTEDLN